MAAYSSGGICFSEIYFVIKQIKASNQDRVRKGEIFFFFLMSLPVAYKG